MQPEELIDFAVQRAEYPEMSNGCAELAVNESTPNMKDHLKVKLEIRERWLLQERKLLRPRVESFIAQMRRVQGSSHCLVLICQKLVIPARLLIDTWEGKWRFSFSDLAWVSLKEHGAISDMCGSKKIKINF